MYPAGDYSGTLLTRRRLNMAKKEVAKPAKDAKKGVPTKPVADAKSPTGKKKGRPAKAK
jgi:hypothetical protein